LACQEIIIPIDPLRSPECAVDEFAALSEAGACADNPKRVSHGSMSGTLPGRTVPNAFISIIPTR
jgi:hypothetical protein